MSITPFAVSPEGGHGLASSGVCDCFLNRPDDRIWPGPANEQPMAICRILDCAGEGEAAGFVGNDTGKAGACKALREWWLPSVRRCCR